MKRGLLCLLVVIAGCKAARQIADKAEKKYDERRAVEKAEEKAAEEKAAKQEAERPVVKPNGPGLAGGKYRIHDLRVTVFATNRKDRPWDDPPGIDPDLEVTLRVDGKKAESCETEDSVHAHCKFDHEIEIDHQARIEIAVIDRDRGGLDDPIGSAVLVDPSTWGVAMDLPFAPSGRIESATLVLARVPTWWELNQARVIGLGIGIALALLVMAMFRQSLFPRDTPLPSEISA